MAPRRSVVDAREPTDHEIHEAVLLMQRYTIEITHAVRGVLGNRATGNIDIGLLVAVGTRPGISPTDAASAIGSPRSTVARALSRLVKDGLVRRRIHAEDRRRIELGLTRRGQQRIDVLRRVLDGYFRDGEPMVKEIAHLLGYEARREPAASALEVASRLAAAGETASADVFRVSREFGLKGYLERAATVMIAFSDTRPSELSNALLLSPTGTSSMLDRLVERGLAERIAGGHHTDGRAVTVRATPRGREAADALVDALWLTTGRP
jgi:DNA-binding MarR family transcriptional regulator